MFFRSLALSFAAALSLGAAPLAAQPSPDPLAPSGRWSLPERKQARTPPMGWNSWNAFRTEVDEAKVIGAARKLVDSGQMKGTQRDALSPINAANLREAHRRLESGTTIGKLVLAGW